MDNTVVAPILEIVKANDPTGTVQEGQTITYTLTVTNTATGAGAGAATNVNINDVAPANTTLVAGSTAYVSGVAPTDANPAAPMWTVATLQPGESTTVSFQVTVNAGTPAGTVILNTAATTSDEITDPVPSNEVDNTVVAPILEIVKAGSEEGALCAGATITYTLTVQNVGDGTATNVLITDEVPENTAFVTGSTAFVAGVPPTDTNPAVPMWTIPTLQPGESTTVSFQVTINEDVPDGTEILNVGETQSDEITTPVISNEVINTVSVPTVTCRQPVSTSTSLGECGNTEIVLLPPFFTTDDCGTPEISNDAPDEFPIGTTTVTHTVTYTTGLTLTCEQTVTVTDTQGPVVGGCTSSIDWAYENCLAQVVIDAEAFDPCGVASVEGTGVFFFPVGIHIHPITFTDSNGNVSIHTITVYVHDDVAPEPVVCPDDVVVSQTEAETFTAPTVSFIDNCEIFSVTNDAPEQFGLGTTTVTWVGEDTYGLQGSCSYNVTVEPNLDLLGMQEIETSVSGAEETARVRWNAPSPVSLCNACPTTDYDNLLFLGEFYGKQYFMSVGTAVTWEEAVAAAELLPGGSLVTVNDLAEDNYLRYALPVQEVPLWIGLEVNQTAGSPTFNWADDSDSDYFNLGDVYTDNGMPVALTLSSAGTWDFAEKGTELGFIAERTCVNLEQTGPYLELISEVGDTTEVLLTSGAEWPTGEYNVTYRASDLCGNEFEKSFPVRVGEEIAEYCTTGGADASVWIAQVSVQSERSGEPQDGGYADFTDDPLTLDADDLTVDLELIAGGNVTAQDLFWRVWVDKNNDGDFFDGNELVSETFSHEAVTEHALNISHFNQEPRRMRIMVSRYDYPEVCADYHSGETEDYLIHYTGNLDFEIAAENPQDGGSDITVSPNPAENETEIFFPAYLHNTALTVFALTGDAVHKTVIAPGQRRYRLPVADLPAGMYFVKVGQTEVKKFTVQR